MKYNYCTLTWQVGGVGVVIARVVDQFCEYRAQATEVGHRMEVGAPAGQAGQQAPHTVCVFPRTAGQHTHREEVHATPVGEFTRFDTVAKLLEEKKPVS